MPSDSTAGSAGPPTDFWTGLWYGLGLVPYAVVVAAGSLLALAGYWDAFLLLGGDAMLTRGHVDCTLCKFVSSVVLAVLGWALIAAGVGGAAYRLRYRPR